MKAPIISVIMSVYNGRKYLSDAVESILNQTFGDFEFLILDDGSTDGSWEILRQYEGCDARFFLVRNEQNLGLVGSLNKGLALVKGEFIARQDVDDISLPKRFEKQIEFLRSHQDVGVLGTGVEEVDDIRKHLRSYFPAKKHDDLVARLLVDNCFRHPTVMVRTHLVRAVGGYDPNFAWAEDYDLLVRLSQRTHLANLGEVLLVYRRGDSFFTNQHRQEQMGDAFKISSNFVRKCLGGRNLDSDAYRRFWWSIRCQDDSATIKNLNLQSQDIDRLEPFWELLGESLSACRVWGLALCRFSLSLLRHGAFQEGFKIFKIAQRLLRRSFGV